MDTNFTNAVYRSIGIDFDDEKYKIDKSSFQKDIEEYIDTLPIDEQIEAIKNCLRLVMSASLISIVCEQKLMLVDLLEEENEKFVYYNSRMKKIRQSLIESMQE